MSYAGIPSLLWDQRTVIFQLPGFYSPCLGSKSEPRKPVDGGRRRVRALSHHEGVWTSKVPPKKRMAQIPSSFGRKVGILGSLEKHGTQYNGLNTVHFGLKAISWPLWRSRSIKATRRSDGHKGICTELPDLPSARMQRRQRPEYSSEERKPVWACK